jgi:hypothetical protein
MQTPESNRSGLADQLRNKASDALSGQKNRATDGLGSIVEAVRSTGRQLGDSNHTGLAGYVNTAADSLQRWTDTLQHKDVGEIVEDIQRFGRRQPALLIGLSFGAGLLGARFLKSSGDAGYRSSREMYGGASYGGATAGGSAYDTTQPYSQGGGYTAERGTGTVRDTSYGTPGTRTDLG